ncbi:MAG: hypothetical protein K9M99_07825 [Candidatus Cloacimonetes bacterium]|nr:hypothetical protein [Candidatus Cloacimonadota bacterium]
MKNIILVIMIILLLSGCKQSPEQRVINPGAQSRILIAMTTTEFKEQIVSRIINDFGERATIEINGLSSLKKVNPAEYDAIIIMDACEAGMKFNASLNNFTSKHTETDNAIFIITAGDPDWEWDNKNYRAITSASETSHISDIVSELEIWLAERIK